MKDIETCKLTISDIPAENADYGTMSVFALTFNGYKFVNGGPVELGDLCDRVMNNGIESASIDELRACMFMEQRSARFCGDADSDYSLIELREWSKLIRERLIVND